MRRTATKFCSNGAVAVVEAEATRGSAICVARQMDAPISLEPTTPPILYNSTLIASTLLLQSFIQALQRLVRARHVVVLMRCSVISKPSETRSSSMEAASSLTLSFALKTRVWETLSRNTISLILGFLRKLDDA